MIVDVTAAKGKVLPWNVEFSGWLNLAEASVSWFAPTAASCCRQDRSA